jgi:deazaflavin-dependent oxidoreductase (nitroreductase family)
VEDEPALSEARPTGDSPVLGAAAGETIKVVTRGRATGLPHIVKVRFVVREGRFMVLAGDVGSDWVKNIRKFPEVKVRLGALSYAADARLAEEEREEVIRLFELKYGRRIVRSWYGMSSVCVTFAPRGAPTEIVVARGEGSVAKTFAEWKREGRGYSQDVASAFDLASEEYDVTIGGNLWRWAQGLGLRQCKSPGGFLRSTPLTYHSR